MKKIITWFTKGSKIKRILKYIYQALVISSKMMSGGVEGVVEAHVTSAEKVTEKITSAQKYVDLAIEYLGVILGWFGISVAEREAIARSVEDEITVIALREKCEKEIF